MYYKVIYNEKSDELKAKRCKDNKKVSKKECELHNVGDVYELTVDTFSVEDAVRLFWLKFWLNYHRYEETKEFENGLFKTKEYCDNNAISTEVKQVLAKLSGKTVNDSANSMIKEIIFGEVKI